MDFVDPEDRFLRMRAQARAEARKRLAGGDPNRFIEAILRDERDEPLVQAPFHREWQVALTDYDRMCLFAPVEHGKTVQLCVGRVLWELGRRQAAGEYPRILLVSNTQSQARKPLASVKAFIEHSTALHQVFPKLRKEAFSEWTGSHIRLEMNRPTTAKDATLQAIGVGGAILGGRIDIAILDDVLDMENTWTQDQRAKLIEWFESTIPGRIVDGGKVWVLGTAWHPKDMMHFLSLNARYSTRKYPAENGQMGHILWPARWSKARLEERKKELTPYRYAQQMLCRAVSDETSRFDPDWFERCKLLGKGLPWPGRPMDLIVAGVDLGVKQKAGSDESAIFVLGSDNANRRVPLWVDHGRWRKREIIAKIQAVHRRYGCTFCVEDNAAQNYLIQDLEDTTSIPTIPYQTKGRRKRDPVYGIESIGVDLENRRWELACDEHGRMPEVLQLWQDQCMEFRPTEHSGDILMASFFALEGMRRYEYGGGLNVA